MKRKEFLALYIIFLEYLIFKYIFFGWLFEKIDDWLNEEV